MKRWLLLAFSLLACAQAVFAQAPTKEVGPVVDSVRQKFARKCQAERVALAGLKAEDAALKRIDVQLDCECGPQAMDAAFPASMRSTRLTQFAFQARMTGAAEVCMARALREQVSAQCAKGDDPFAHPGDTPSPARASARCACMQSSIGKVAELGFAQAANDSAARFDAQLAATGPGQPQPTPAPPGRFIQETALRCGAVTAPAK